jgi:hypothetical protein
MKLSGWPIVGWTAVVVGVMSALLFVLYGTGDEGLHAAIRHTAQTSFVVFMAAYVAAPLRTFWRSDTSKWMLANRRYLGVSYAVSHTYHIAFIVLLAATSTSFREGVGMVTIIGGGGAYVFMYAMAATSFDRTAAMLGRRNWQRLHTVGIHYNWFIFFQSYLGRALKPSLLYAPFALLMLAGLGLRVARWWRARRPAPSLSMATPRTRADAE